MKFHTQTVAQGDRGQDESLRAIARLIRSGIEDPRVRATALKIVRDCEARDDECELRAIYEAVKNGEPAVKALERGFPYRADPKNLDWFQGARRSLSMCEAGACGGDCDDHTILNASLAGALGFTVGARGYGKSRSGPLSHVYAIAVVPKKASGLSGNGRIVGMDTTVPSASFGWQPPPGRYRTILAV